MKLIASLSVKARLGTLVLMSLAGTLLVAGVGLYGVHLATRSALVVAERHLPAEGLIGELRASIGKLRRFEKGAFLSTGKPEGVNNYVQSWQAALQHERQTLKDIEPLLDDEALALLAGVRDSIDRYAHGFDAVAARLMRGEFADAASANNAMEPLQTDIRQLDEQLMAMKKHVDAKALQERDALVVLQRHETVVQAVVVVLVAGAATGFAAAVVRSITGPLQQAQTALTRLAAGDLTQTLHAEGRDELSQMIQRLAHTQAALRELVQGIQGNAQNVASASSEIAQGNADLSERTERQAASLQQTAASMEQLNATVRAGAETARQANGMAKAASESARQGGAVVAEVVQTMAGIQQASRRIADITGVIDSIAFQTNILALNAAVEAARAGEEGRGFAVVAAEVRTLAQRSADAAREIKALIGDSVERVEAGHQLVQRAGGTLDEAVQQVQRVTDLVAQISSTVGEQHQGLAQIGVAVNQLDEATQQNAALVEESAAASDSLRQQAERLNTATAVFRLDGARA